MASYDAAMNSATPTAKGQGAAFGPIQAPSVTSQGGPPPTPPGGSPPGGSPGMPPGSVAPGAFPAGMPPNLVNILMGANPGQPQVPNIMPGNAGGLGAPGGSGAFASGFGPGQSMVSQGLHPAPSPSPGAFGRMGSPAMGSPSWASSVGRK